MDIKQYQTEAENTKSPEFHAENHAPWEVVRVLSNVQSEADFADVLKKSLFYNKPFDDSLWDGYLANGMVEGYDGDYYTHIDVLHGVLGVITEAGELAEIIKENLKDGAPIDVRNLMDECGDVMWYLAILFTALGVTFEDVAGMNNAKLKARFPNKFDADKAINR